MPFEDSRDSLNMQLPQSLGCKYALVPVVVVNRLAKEDEAMRLLMTIVLLGGQDIREPSWPSPVPAYRAPAAGEHPRLLFRKEDLPALRERAGTPEGKLLVERLRRQLNGSDGESMPPAENPRRGKQPDGSGDFEKTAPPGAYTYSHAAGFGLLYRLTGDKKYAELGRKCMEKALDGVRDVDNRYSFRQPTGALRAGPSLGWTALGYDLCYDGWEEGFRMKVAKAIADYDEGRWMSLAELAQGKRQHPGSNHWGMQVGGAALALLAVMNDPGVDMGKIGPLLEANGRTMIRNMTEGFGNGGFFAEGDGTGSMSSHIAFITGLQAWRTAGGRDYVGPRSNAQWMALRWFFQTVPRGDGSRPADWFWPHRGGYPHNIWARDGVSGGGYFSQGFGILTQEQKAGVLWFYNHSPLREMDQKNKTPFDTPSRYPHHTICALANWPFGLKERNPAEVIPRCFRDTKWHFYAFRNRWQDENDVVITTLLKASKGNMGSPADGALKIQAFGKRQDWGNVRGEARYWRPAADGSAVLTLGDGTGLAVDFSGASGAEAMLVMTGPGAGRGVAVEAGGVSYSFLFLSSGAPPAPRADGERVVVGRQSVSMKDGNIVLGHMAAPWPGPVNMHN